MPMLYLVGEKRSNNRKEAMNQVMFCHDMKSYSRDGEELQSEILDGRFCFSVNQ